MWQFEVQIRQGGELNLGEMYLKFWKKFLWKLFETDKDKKKQILKALTNKMWRKRSYQ